MLTMAQYEKPDHHQSPKTYPMLLPETWEEILTNLPPKDFHSAINTCPEWNQLMHFRKSNYLLPLALPLLVDYLPLETVLRMREITKRTLDATDLLLEHHPGFRPTTATRAHFNKLSPIDMKYNFGNVEQIIGFIHRMESRPFPENNPFLMRSLTMRLNGWRDEEISSRAQAFRQLFTIYGHHLYKIHLREMLIDGRTLEKFVSLLTQLPNIKSINILGGVRMEEEFLSQIAFPKLSKLEELHFFTAFKDVSLESTFCLKLLSQYGQQLKSLSMNNLLRSENVSSELLSLLVPNLSWFELASINTVALRKLASVSWPLEKLLVWGEQVDFSPNSTVLAFLEMVNNFSKTLVNLKFMLARNEMFQGDVNLEGMVAFPKLKVLTFELANLKLGWIWEFLRICCQNVSELYLMTNSSISLEDEQLAKSLFDVLPMLRKIVVLPNFIQAGVKRKIILR